MNFMTDASRRGLEKLTEQIMEESSARGVALGITDAEGNIL